MQAKGNAAFSAGSFEEAIEYFSKGIEADGSNHVLYSNRSAAQVIFNASAMFLDSTAFVLHELSFFRLMTEHVSLVANLGHAKL